MAGAIERRPAAARRERASPDKQSHAAAGVRAHRSAGHAQRRAGYGAPGPASPRGPDDSPGHPRRQARDPACGARAQRAGRKDRRRRAAREPGAGSLRGDPRPQRGRVAMTAIIIKAIRDLRRRRLQAAVIFLTVFLSMAAGTMAVTWMSQTRDPYQAAFDKQRGAHLQVAFDAKTDLHRLAKTPAAIGAS